MESRFNSRAVPVNIKTYVLYSTVILAIVLRLYKVQETFGFFTDQGYDLLSVYHMMRTGEIPLVGPLVSFGAFHMGPLYLYLITPFVFLARYNPIGPVMVPLIGGITLLIVGYRLLNTYISSNAALVFILFVALSPRLIFLSRGSWSNNLQAVFGVLYVFCLINFLVKPDKRKGFLVGLVFGAGIQMHYLFFTYILPTLFALAIFRQKNAVRLGTLVSVLGGFLLPLLPFFVGQAQQQTSDIRSILSYVLENSTPHAALQTRLLLETIVLPFRLYVPLIIARHDVYYAIFIALSVVTISTSSYIILKIIALFLLLPTLQVYWLNLQLLPHYFDSFGIWALVLFSYVVYALINHRVLKPIGYLLLSFVLVSNIVLLPNNFKVSRSPQAAFDTSAVITADYRRQSIANPISIYAISPVTSTDGNEFVYLLNLHNIPIKKTTNVLDSSYIIYETNENGYLSFSPTHTILSHKKLDGVSDEIRYVTIYKKITPDEQ